jgi:tetratricopeptide (TPR) repeat protein
MQKPQLSRLEKWVNSRLLNGGGDSEFQALVIAYLRMTDQLENNPADLATAFLLRARLESEANSRPGISRFTLQRLINADQKLVCHASQYTPHQIAALRKMLHPEVPSIWWQIEFPRPVLNQPDKHAPGREILWPALTAALMTISALLLLEIIQRLWLGAPNTGSVLGSLVTLIVGASPFTEAGRRFSRWFYQTAFGITVERRARAMAGMSFISLTIILGIYFLVLPSLAVFYNNLGNQKLGQGKLAEAQLNFLRASAIDDNLVVPYHNLASIYLRIGQPEHALNLYTKALEVDLNFQPAYAGLGHIYNLMGEHTKAELILQAGLACLCPTTEEDIRLISSYEILVDLGWAYYKQGKYGLALEALQEAVALESQLVHLENERQVIYRLALPHIFLGMLYEQQYQQEAARFHFEESLRFLDAQNWADREWLRQIEAKLESQEE